MSNQTCMIHLNHPCREIDVWMVESDEEIKIGRGQGYVPLEELRRLTTRIAELERQLAQRKYNTDINAAILQTPQYDPLWA